MAFFCIASWIRKRLTRDAKNEVAAIQITVQPRQHVKSPEHNNISVFAVEDELQYARLWYFNDNYSVHAATVLREQKNSDSNGSQFIKMSEFPRKLSRDENSAVSNTSFTGTSNQLTLTTLQTMSPQHIPKRNSSQKNGSHVIHFKRSLSNAKQQTQEHSYIHSYLRIMYLFCISGVNTRTNKETDVVGMQKWFQWIGVKIQMGTFGLFAFLSAFQSFCQAKYDVLWFLFEGGLNQFVKFSFNVTTLATSAYCAYLLCNKWEAIKKMVDAMSSYEQNRAAFNKKPATCVSLATITTLLALFMSLIISDIRDFSIEDAMLESSFQMSEDLFLWSSQHLNLSISKLDQEFGIELNSVEIVLAVVKILRDFAYYLQDGMIWDLIVCVVFTLFCWMKLFMGYVVEVMDNVLDKTSEEYAALQQQRELVWMMYRKIRIAFEAVNNVFGMLLIYFHASNVLRYAFFMENLIYPGNIKLLAYVHLLYNIVKSEITYIVAARVAQQNKIIRKWLRNWGSQTGKIDVGYTEIDMNAVLDELDEEPLGLGTGDFMINQGFHFGLLGLVSSLFVMLASKKQ